MIQSVQSSSDRVLLFSGGLDSFCLWHLLHRPPCMYALLGHKYEARERQSIGVLQAEFGFKNLEVTFVDRLTLGDLEMDDAHIPLRNVYLTMLASHLSDTVILGSLRGEQSYDKDKTFERLTTKLVSRCEQSKFRVIRPAAKWTKAQLVREYLKRGGKEKWLGYTVSCYEPEGFCGKCQSCFRRWVAMSLNGIEEKYATKPYEKDFHEKAIQAMWKHGVRGALRTWPSNLDAWAALRRARNGIKT
jgi:7-cyano-7-deazaguanine synthase in queuosine biosynthesis